MTIAIPDKWKRVIKVDVEAVDINDNGELRYMKKIKIKHEHMSNLNGNLSIETLKTNMFTSHVYMCVKNKGV